MYAIMACHHSTLIELNSAASPLNGSKTLTQDDCFLIKFIFGVLESSFWWFATMSRVGEGVKFVSASN